MSKLNIYFLYIIALIPWTEYAIPSSENAWCVDCTDQTYPCEIKHSGYHCMGGGRPAVDIFEDAIDFLPAITSDLDACIPSSLNITGWVTLWYSGYQIILLIHQIPDDDFQICCIWSPELGCQLIVLKDSYLSFPCSICQGIESEILKSCPC
ncbi:hypothetical protein KR009_001222, partial [Drosophila setifemur]